MKPVLLRLAVLILCGSTIAASDAPERFVATNGVPISIPLVRLDHDGLPVRTARYVDITVHRFAPSFKGPVQIVVTSKDGSKCTEIGRFGIYPERAFASGGPIEPMRFRLTLPAGVKIDRSTRLTLRILPAQGTGDGAMIEVEQGQFR